MAARKWKLTTIIGATITALVVVTALSVALPLYATYDEQMVREFQAKTAAGASGAAAEMQADLSDVSSRVDHLAATITTDQPRDLANRLASSPQPDGVLYFVLHGLEILCSGPVDMQERALARALMAGEEPEGEVIRTRNSRPYVGIITRVDQPGEAVDAVCALYPLRLLSAKTPVGGTLLVDPRQDPTELESGAPVELRFDDPAEDHSGQAALATLDGEDGLWRPLPGFASVGLFMPHAELNATRRAGMGVAMGLTFLTVAVGIVVSIFLGRLLARPLGRMAVAVRRVADGVAEPTEFETSRIAELDQCSGSLLEIVSNLKQTEELKRYQELFDSVGEAVCLLGPDGRILETNEVAPIKFGIPRKEFLKANAFDFVAPRLHDTFREALLAVIEHGEERTVETNCVAPDGKVYETEHHMRRTSVMKRPVALSVNIDITKRKRMERDLIASKQAAESANRAKNEFLANMSHELRTPLNSVMGLLDVLSESQLDHVQRQCVTVASGSAASLLTIISDILDITKMEAGKLLLCHDIFRPGDMLAGISESFGAEAVGKGLHFFMDIDPDLPEYLVGDAGRVRQVLFNVVGNAVKFTNEGSVRVDVAPVSHAGNPGAFKVLFTVADTGIGIPPEMQAFVLDSFTQADGSHSRNYQGTGLGLGLVRRLVEMMEGTLDMESEVGRGTTMYIALPLRQATPTSEKPLFAVEESAPEPANDGELTVLLVEDNVANQMTIQSMLDSLGHRSLCAENGQKALDLLAESGVRFDLVLMDVQMPVMDGFDATRAIRAHPDPKIATLPVVAVTAHAMQGDRRRCLDAGMDDYIAKPVRKVTLDQVIRHAMTRHQT